MKSMILMRVFFRFNSSSNMLPVKIFSRLSVTTSLPQYCRKTTIDKYLPNDKNNLLYHKFTCAPVLFWGDNICYDIDFNIKYLSIFIHR